MNEEHIITLIKKYNEGTLSPEERMMVDTWYMKYVSESESVLSEETEEAMVDRLKAVLPLVYERPVKSLWTRIAVAASVAILIGIGLWFFSNVGNLDGKKGVNGLAQDIAPGKNIAILTLADGKTIKLSEAKSGIVIDASSVNYSDGSPIAPSVDNNEQLIAATPRGGQYQITLPDGTKVWLNADTRLKFPQSFAKMKERLVELRGEAYFEVSKDKNHPFTVKTDRQEVVVLGTHFNINSYTDEANTKTTLLEGSVQVSPSTSSGFNGGLPNTYVLKPGQQASIGSQNQLKIMEVDTEGVVAWKDGKFQFYRADVKTVMRQLARWYNVEVEYQGTIPDREFTGIIFRDVNASEALSILKELDVKFKIEGRKVIITP